MDSMPGNLPAVVEASDKEEEEQSKSAEEREEGKGLLDRPIEKAAIRPLLLKYVSLLVLVLQSTCHVLMSSYATNLPMIFAGRFIFFTHHFISNFVDTLKVGIPASIYLVQNILVYLAIEQLDGGTYIVTYQLKILTTAMFTVLILKRRLSFFQWMALLVLVAGVAIVLYCDKNDCEVFSSEPQITSNASLLAKTTNSTSISTSTDRLNCKKEKNAFLGLLYVLVACFLSGFAGIYFEKILKGSEVSIWLRNVQLSVLSMPILLAIIGVQDFDVIQRKGFMYGFDYIIWSIVLLQAVGGLVVAVVIKYADNILKAFATAVSILVATIASIILLNTKPKLMFFLGAALVIAAVVIYSIFPYRTKEKTPIVKKCGKENLEELQVIVNGGEGGQQEDEEQENRETK
uniref:UDP-galactose transporter n=1 Tax=Globodera rostochiensis TaxID=31243 RepID=A0A914I5B6_GLORO